MRNKITNELDSAQTYSLLQIAIRKLNWNGVCAQNKLQNYIPQSWLCMQKPVKREANNDGGLCWLTDTKLT